MESVICTSLLVICVWTINLNYFLHHSLDWDPPHEVYVFQVVTHCCWMWCTIVFNKYGVIGEEMYSLIRVLCLEIVLSFANFNWVWTKYCLFQKFRHLQVFAKALTSMGFITTFWTICDLVEENELIFLFWVFKHVFFTI